MRDKWLASLSGYYANSPEKKVTIPCLSSIIHYFLDIPIVSDDTGWESTVVLPRKDN